MSDGIYDQMIRRSDGPQPDPLVPEPGPHTPKASKRSKGK